MYRSQETERIRSSSRVCRALGDYLLYRDNDGIIRGIFHRYARDIWPFITAGEFCIIVQPHHRRREIGTTLLAEPDRRFTLDFTIQTYTRAGAALISAYQREPSAS